MQCANSMYTLFHTIILHTQYGKHYKLKHVILHSISYYSSDYPIDLDQYFQITELLLIANLPDDLQRRPFWLTQFVVSNIRVTMAMISYSQ